MACVRADLGKLPRFGADILKGEFAGEAERDEPFWIEMVRDNIEDLAGNDEEIRR